MSYHLFPLLSCLVRKQDKRVIRWTGQEKKYLFYLILQSGLLWVLDCQGFEFLNKMVGEKVDFLIFLDLSSSWIP